MTVRTFGTNIAEQSSVVGTGTYQLDGALIGYLPFSDQFVLNDTPYYCVKNADESKYEFNKGAIFTPGGPSTLARNVWLSSNANAAVSWTSDDLPLTVFIPTSGEIMEAMLTGWLAAARNAMITFGMWWKTNGISAGIHQLNFYDGSSDIPIAEVNPTNHSVRWYGTVYRTYFSSATPDTTTSIIPLDNTIPQNTEGKSFAPFAAQAFTVKSATSKIRLRAVIQAANAAAASIQVAFFIDSGANAVAVGTKYEASNPLDQIVFDQEITNPGLGAHTISMRFGASSANAVYLNSQGTVGTAIFGGVYVSTINIEEWF